MLGTGRSAILTVCVCRLSEELLRCQEEVRRLQVALSSTRSECSSVSEERLSLQQENQQLQRDLDSLRKECVSAQRHAHLQVHIHTPPPIGYHIAGHPIHTVKLCV